MTDGVQIALIVLLALLVGALLPLLVSAFSLIKRAKQTLTVIEQQAVTLTDNTSQVLARVETIAEGVQEELPTLRRTSQRVDELGTSIERLTETVQKIQAAGQILGPAIAAGLNAYRAVRQNQPAVGPDDALPEAVTDAILDEIKAQAEANGDLEAPGDAEADS